MADWVWERFERAAEHGLLTRTRPPVVPIEGTRWEGARDHVIVWPLREELKRNLGTASRKIVVAPLGALPQR